MADTAETITQISPAQVAKRQLAIAGAEFLLKEANLTPQEAFGPVVEVSDPAIKTPGQLREYSHIIWTAFFGKEVVLHQAPQELFDTLSRARDNGINIYAPHLLPEVDLLDVKEAPGWIKKPEKWLYDEIKAGRVNREAMRLNGNAILFETTPKPPYSDGLQLYSIDDPFSGLLEEGRSQEEIAITEYTGHIPPQSRYGISPIELFSYVNPKIADLLVVDRSQARSPRVGEFSILGNAFYPYLGLTDTAEWFEDEIRFSEVDVRRLYGGRSDVGGLSGVNFWYLDVRDGDVGFRSLVDFPSRKA